MKLPKNFKKSYKFFCLGLDIRVPEIVHPDNFQIYCRTDPGDSLSKPDTGPGKDSLIRIQMIDLVCIVPDLCQEKLRDINHPVALLRLWWLHNIFPVDISERFIDPDLLCLKVYIIHCQSQQLAFSHSGIKQDLESCVQLNVVFDMLRKLSVFFRCPEINIPLLWLADLSNDRTSGQS